MASRRCWCLTAFRVRLGAVPSVLAGLRRDLAGWLHTIGATEPDVWNAQLAVVEAVTNRRRVPIRAGGAW